MPKQINKKIMPEVLQFADMLPTADQIELVAFLRLQIACSENVNIMVTAEDWQATPAAVKDALVYIMAMGGKPEVRAE